MRLMRPKIFLFVSIILFLQFLYGNAFAVENIVSNIRTFPIENYSQNVNFWLNVHDKNYTNNLLTREYQEQRLNELKHHYYGTAANDNSPWSESYLNFLFKSQMSLKEHEAHLLDLYRNASGLDYDSGYSAKNISGDNIDTDALYGMNFRKYNQKWFDELYLNMQFKQFNSLIYQAQNRAVLVSNTLLRSLPTNDPFFHDNKIAGEGYPFDSLQQTAAFTGTPIYILAETADDAWDLVLTPDYIGWVNSQSVAKVDNKFIQKWQTKAYANLVGISKSNQSVVNSYHQYLFSGFVGMLFPLNKDDKQDFEILVPLKSENGMAKISTAKLSNNSAQILPLMASPQSFAKIITSLQGRPYGWGGLAYYNDCSSEMKAIFTMMGIFLPRNTSEQSLAGMTTDLSKYNTSDRIKALMKIGKPLLTLVYIKGHIFLYVGKYKNQDGVDFPLSYQEMWGLKPRNQSYRVIVGEGVFFPLLETYPEDKNVLSHAGWSNFILVDLSQNPVKPIKLTLDDLVK